MLDTTYAYCCVPFNLDHGITSDELTHDAKAAGDAMPCTPMQMFGSRLLTAAVCLSCMCGYGRLRAAALGGSDMIAAEREHFFHSFLYFLFRPWVHPGYAVMLQTPAHDWEV